MDPPEKQIPGVHQILGIAAAVVLILAVGPALAAISERWDALSLMAGPGVGLVVDTVAFALIYKLVPRAKVDWRDVWIGAVVTAMLFSLGAYLVGLYIVHSGVARGYGAASSVVVLLVWLYYSAQIFLLGAEFTWAYATAFGSRQSDGLRPAA